MPTPELQPLHQEIVAALKHLADAIINHLNMQRETKNIDTPMPGLLPTCEHLPLHQRMVRPMTDAITAMTTTIRGHQWNPSLRRCACGMTLTADNHAGHIVDVLLVEHLKPEFDYGTTYPNVPVTDRKYVRYVTTWTAADA